LTHSRPHQALPFFLQPAKLPYLPDTHITITKDRMLEIQFREKLTLYMPRGLDAPANRLSHSIIAQLFIFHSWNFDANIYTI